MATTRARWRFFRSRPLVLVCETPRLIVRRLTVDDADAAFILRLLNEPSFLQNIGDRGVRLPDDARAYITNGAVASYEKHGFGLFHVSLKATGEAIGMCGLLRRDWLDGVDVGFAFLPEFWGKGYAYESSVGVIGWGRASLGITRVLGITKADNHGSIRVLEKLGLKFAGMVTSPEGQESKLFAP
jgi:RimJ/RimL family protein N-acetyltransferase